MKRGLAMLAALLLLLGLMSGCGGSDTSGATASDMVATEETADNGSYGGNMAAQMPESPAERGGPAPQRQDDLHRGPERGDHRL